MPTASDRFRPFTPTSTNTGSIMEVLPQYQRDPSALVAALHPFVDRTSSCRLRAVAKITRSIGPLTIIAHRAIAGRDHFLQPGARRFARHGRGPSPTTCKRELHMPATITASFQGSAQVFQSSLKGLGILLLMSILVIYIILGILYESFIHPITILSGLAFGGLRRAAHADAFRNRPEHLRVRRLDHAGRHREEERDHDDRLRARCRAPGQDSAPKPFIKAACCVSARS